jgi:hypothetical protein
VRFSGALGTPYQKPAARTVFDFDAPPSCSDPGFAGAFGTEGDFGAAGAFGAGGADCSARRSAETATDAGMTNEGMPGV